MSFLYIVATPIGNFKDITLRALEILSMVNIIACEDTRCTQKLLDFHAIYGKTLMRCNAHNENGSALKIVEIISKGKNVAYCSDAGTPALSDPGSSLVLICLKHNIKVIPIPGVSAFSTLMSVSGLSCSHVYFVGFLPRLPGKRMKAVHNYLDNGFAFLLYESPHRVHNLVGMICEYSPERFLVLGREMTKTYEEFLYGTAKEIRNVLEKKKIYGEVSILVANTLQY